MLEQLLAHLVGDYILQTERMAREKRTNPWAALTHASAYSFPFLLLSPSLPALAVIIFTHWAIDHYGLARYVVFAKNWVTEPGLRWADCKATGYPATTPAWMAVWLLIIADNTIHLCINYAALRWL